MKASANTGNLLDLASQRKGAITQRLGVKNLEWGLLIAALILSDLVLYNMAFRAAYWIRYESNWPITQYWIQPAIDYVHLSLLSLPLFIAIFAIVSFPFNHNTF